MIVSMMFWSYRLISPIIVEVTYHPRPKVWLGHQKVLGHPCRAQRRRDAPVLRYWENWRI